MVSIKLELINMTYREGSLRKKVLQLMVNSYLTNFCRNHDLPPGNQTCLKLVSFPRGFSHKAGENALRCSSSANA